MMNCISSNPVVLQPKLTRACKACVKAKRKCSFNLPKCARCEERGAICEYENQPLTERDIRPKTKCDVEGTLQLIDSVAQKTTNSIEPANPSPSLTCIRLDEPICTLSIDGRTLTFQNNHLKKHIISFSETGTTTFIHPKTAPSPLLSNVRSLISTLISDQTFVYTSCLQTIQKDHMRILTHSMESLLAALPTLQDYDRLLPFTQALMLFQILTLFVVPARLLPEWVQRTTEARHELLKRVTQKLWDSAPTYLPSYLSKHEGYALAESIRRTVIMSHELQAQCSLYMRGFFEYRLSVASLPFDRRFELWDANTLEFIEATETIGNGHGPQHMVSYREFCDMFDRMEVKSIETPFETMLLVGAKGLDLVEHTYGLHLT
jgi:hypothetical protein